MVNLKQLLLKLLQRNQKIGESSNSYLNQIYPINSVVITSHNTSPSTMYGGTWTLIHKDFSTASWEDNTSPTSQTGAVFTFNSTYWTPGNYCAIIRCPNFIMVRLQFQNKLALSNTKMRDNTVQIGSFILSELGITENGGFSQMFVIGADGLNMTGMGRFRKNGSTWDVCVDDWVGNGTVTAYTSGTGQNCYLTFYIYPCFEYKLDSACDKFYWKRTA